MDDTSEIVKLTIQRDKLVAALREANFELCATGVWGGNGYDFGPMTKNGNEADSICLLKAHKIINDAIAENELLRGLK